MGFVDMMHFKVNKAPDFTAYNSLHALISSLSETNLPKPLRTVTIPYSTMQKHSEHNDNPQR